MNNPEILCSRDPDVEGRVQEIGAALFHSIENEKPSLLDPQRYSAQLMEWAMADDGFRTALFRFVDVLPSLESGSSVVRIAQEYFLPVADRFPGLLKWGLKMNPDGLQAKAAAFLIRSQIAGMGQQFILGENPKAALPALRKIRKEGRAFTVDLLGEACLSDTEAEVYKNRYLELIHTLAQGRFEAVRPDHPGDHNPVNVSVKLSALSCHSKPIHGPHAIATLAPALRAIFEAVKEVGGTVYVDMENHAKKDLILDTVCTVLEEETFRDWNGAGFVLQAYLRSAPHDLKRLHEWLKATGRRVGLRLVKGAYWDTETVQARLNRWPVPVWQEKVSSDICFESLTQYLLTHPEHFYPAFASHNLRSLAFAMATAEKRSLGPEHFEIQALYGMAEPIKESVSRRGYLVREYAPVGELVPGMAYLVRRLLENTSNKGFIRQRFHEGDSAASLMQRPETETVISALDYVDQCYARHFMNAPLADFADKGQRAALLSAVQEQMQQLETGPAALFPIIGGQPFKDCTEFLDTACPDFPEKSMARVGLLGSDDVDRVLQQLANAFPAWKSRSQEDRSALMEAVADRIEADRAGMVAVIVLECGKPIAEADADVAEAIDFLRYYAREARRLGAERELCGLDGETDHLIYEPRGVAVVIGPWNFAAAIPCGMFAAALVTGNTAALKPAEQSMAVAERLFRHFLEAGVPPDVMAFVPGRGEAIGPALVESPLTDTILFTGSRNVGLSILKAASEWKPGQRHIKRVIAEMGGKNAIIVDESADLDQAVQGIVESAFGFAGQKCSACSRVFAHAAIYPRLKERLAEAVRSLVCGPAHLPEVDLGPVIDDESLARLTDLRQRLGTPTAEGTLHPRTSPTAYFVPPTLYCDVDRESEFMTEEWFGPLLGLCPAPDFETAIKWANESVYSLTGGVYSRSPASLTMAARTFNVGNLYLNRNCTGALVGRQPFGGAALSGVGSKAGGPDYLLQLVIPRVVSENTMRQGFAPMTD